MKRIVIMGSAPCLEDDLQRLAEIAGCGDITGLAASFDFLAVGLDCADRYLGRIEHAVSYHPKEFKEFRQRREKAGGNLDYISHGHNENGFADRIWPYFSPSGSSAMLGVEVALGLGYERVVVAGVLLEAREYKRFRAGWNVRFFGTEKDYPKDDMQNKKGTLSGRRDQVKAMSGYPVEILGSPTAEWLQI